MRTPLTTATLVARSNRGQLADLLVLRLIGDRGVVLALAAFALLATLAADRVEAEQVRDDMGAVPPARIFHGLTRLSHLEGIFSLRARKFLLLSTSALRKSAKTG